MRYMILDRGGNAVDAFRTKVAARATLRAIVAEEPDAAGELVLVAFDDTGKPVGDATVFADLPPAVTYRETRDWVLSVHTSAVHAAVEGVGRQPHFAPAQPRTPVRQEPSRA